MKNETARRNLIPAEDVERRWLAVLTGIRSRVLAVPSRVRRAIPHLTAGEVAKVDREVRAALEDESDAGQA